MGQRTVKRVPLDFDHPRDEPWPGYVRPAARPCPAGDACHNGYTAAGAYLETVVRDLLLAGCDAAAGKPPHPYLRETLSRAPFPTPDLAEVTTGLAGRAPFAPFGHDAIDAWNATKAIVKAAGLDDDAWGICPACQGNARHPDDSFDDWEATEPPVGDGWQLWETTSEGSPVSPVFETAEGLASWCATNQSQGYLLHDPDSKVTYERWLAILTDEDPATAVASETTMRSIIP